MGPELAGVGALAASGSPGSGRPRVGARSSLPTRGAGSTPESGTCAPGVAPVPPGRPRGKDLWVAASRPPRHARRGSKSDAHEEGLKMVEKDPDGGRRLSPR